MDDQVGNIVSITNKKKENWTSDSEIILIRLHNGEYWELAIPKKLCEEHMDFLNELINDPSWDWDAVVSLKKKFPNLTEWEATKIWCFYTLITPDE